jgi:hypothetical protein
LHKGFAYLDVELCCVNNAPSIHALRKFSSLHNINLAAT